ncbi:hypothetical protein AVEN_77543-1 [Araneus ventricosus]|uniref:Uncharacterized protein n=1 Tax=Araneus ventricosus TaxID=182803 RepID=A0A4Y2PKG6_ARAVE|nr:hypothetical protein AVEN_77543-1 [Araneus ventricosus]
MNCDEDEDDEDGNDHDAEINKSSRYPTTAPCGSFCLLRFRPGPVRSALGDLVRPGSPSPTISTPCLARTPDQHGETEDRTPNLTPSDSLALLAAGLQDHATGLGRFAVANVAL